MVVCTGPIAGQVESGGLDDVAAWGFSGLAQDEAPLPETLWSASEATHLLPLLKTVRTSGLSPGERALLRQVILSPATAPGGEDDAALLAERARLMFEIGEADAAARFLPQVPATPEGLNADEIAADLLLAIGKEDEACERYADPETADTRQGAYWAQLRAVCFALADDAAAAGLAVELAAAEGVEDSWFINAVFAAAGATSRRPAARFDTGLALALSAKGALEPDPSAITASRPDLAAALAKRDVLAPALRVQAAGVAAETGLLTGADHRQTYEALFAIEGFAPRTPLEVALYTAWSEDEDAATKARTLFALLQSADGNLTRYAAVARLVQPTLADLPITDDTRRSGLAFFRASLATGDVESARKWLEAAKARTEPAEDAFDLAWSEGLLVLADPEDADVTELTQRLLESVGGKKRKEAFLRLLTLWQASGIVLPSSARAALFTPDNTGTTASSGLALRSIAAGVDAGAAGEVALKVLAATSGDPYAMAPGDMAALVQALRYIGAVDASRTLALEATGYWRETL
ncbi:MAG: hypothetical protein AAGJ29_06320 [Pseudomonadota bacterium]